MEHYVLAGPVSTVALAGATSICQHLVTGSDRRGGGRRGRRDKIREVGERRWKVKGRRGVREERRDNKKIEKGTRRGGRQEERVVERRHARRVRKEKGEEK